MINHQTISYRNNIIYAKAGSAAAVQTQQSDQNNASHSEVSIQSDSQSTFSSQAQSVSTVPTNAGTDAAIENAVSSNTAVSYPIGTQDLSLETYSGNDININDILLQEGVPVDDLHRETVQQLINHRISPTFDRITALVSLAKKIDFISNHLTQEAGLAVAEKIAADPRLARFGSIISSELKEKTINALADSYTKLSVTNPNNDMIDGGNTQNGSPVQTVDNAAYSNKTTQSNHQTQENSEIQFKRNTHDSNNREVPSNHNEWDNATTEFKYTARSTASAQSENGKRTPGEAARSDSAEAARHSNRFNQPRHMIQTEQIQSAAQSNATERAGRTRQEYLAEQFGRVSHAHSTEQSGHARQEYMTEQSKQPDRSNNNADAHRYNVQNTRAEETKRHAQSGANALSKHSKHAAQPRTVEQSGPAEKPVYKAEKARHTGDTANASVRDSRSKQPDPIKQTGQSDQPHSTEQTGRARQAASVEQSRYSGQSNKTVRPNQTIHTSQTVRPNQTIRTNNSTGSGGYNIPSDNAEKITLTTQSGTNTSLEYTEQQISVEQSRHTELAANAPTQDRRLKQSTPNQHAAAQSDQPHSTEQARHAAQVNPTEQTGRATQANKAIWSAQTIRPHNNTVPGNHSVQAGKAEEILQPFDTKQIQYTEQSPTTEQNRSAAQPTTTEQNSSSEQSPTTQQNPSSEQSPTAEQNPSTEQQTTVEQNRHKEQSYTNRQSRRVEQLNPAVHDRHPKHVNSAELTSALQQSNEANQDVQSERLKQIVQSGSNTNSKQHGHQAQINSTPYAEKSTSANDYASRRNHTSSTIRTTTQDNLPITHDADIISDDDTVSDFDDNNASTAQNESIDIWGTNDDVSATDSTLTLDYPIDVDVLYNMLLKINAQENQDTQYDIPENYIPPDVIPEEMVENACHQLDNNKEYTPMEKSTVKMMLALNIPLTAKNLKKILSYHEKVEQLKTIDSDAAAIISRNKTQLHKMTIDTLLAAASYAKTLKSGKSIEQTMLDLESNIKKVFAKNNITWDQTHINMAKSLLKSDLGITAENMEIIENILSDVQTIQSANSEEFAALLLKSGVNPGTATIDLLSDMQKLLQKMQKIQESKAQSLIKGHYFDKLKNQYMSQSTDNLHEHKISDSALSKMDGKIESILKNIKVAVTRENIDICKALILSDIEVNEENIAHFQNLKDKLSTTGARFENVEKIKNNGESLELEDIDSLIENLKDSGQLILKNHTRQDSRLHQIESLIGKISQLRIKDFSTIAALMKKDIPITINTLTSVSAVRSGRNSTAPVYLSSSNTADTASESIIRSENVVVSSDSPKTSTVLSPSSRNANTGFRQQRLAAIQNSAAIRLNSTSAGQNHAAIGQNSKSFRHSVSAEQNGTAVDQDANAGAAQNSTAAVQGIDATQNSTAAPDSNTASEQKSVAAIQNDSTTVQNNNVSAQESSVTIQDNNTVNHGSSTTVRDHNTAAQNSSEATPESTAAAVSDNSTTSHESSTVVQNSSAATPESTAAAVSDNSTTSHESSTVVQNSSPATPESTPTDIPESSSVAAQDDIAARNALSENNVSITKITVNNIYQTAFAVNRIVNSSKEESFISASAYLYGKGISLEDTPVLTLASLLNSSIGYMSKASASYNSTMRFKREIIAKTQSTLIYNDDNYQPVYQASSRNNTRNKSGDNASGGPFGQPKPQGSRKTAAGSTAHNASSSDAFTKNRQRKLDAMHADDRIAHIKNKFLEEMSSSDSVRLNHTGAHKHDAIIGHDGKNSAKNADIRSLFNAAKDGHISSNERFTHISNKDRQHSTEQNIENPQISINTSSQNSPNAMKSYAQENFPSSMEASGAKTTLIESVFSKIMSSVAQLKDISMHQLAYLFKNDVPKNINDLAAARQALDNSYSISNGVSALEDLLTQYIFGNANGNGVTANIFSQNSAAMMPGMDNLTTFYQNGDTYLAAGNLLAYNTDNIWDNNKGRAILKELANIKKILPGTNLKILKDGATITDIYSELKNKLRVVETRMSRLGVSPDDPAVKILSSMKENIRAQEHLNKNQICFQIPILYNQKPSSITVYVFDHKRNGKSKKSDDDFSVTLNLETESLGNVDIHMKLIEKNVNLEIVVSNKSTEKYLNGIKSTLETRVREAGFNVGDISCEMKKREPEKSAVIQPLKRLSPPLRKANMTGVDMKV